MSRRYTYVSDLSGRVIEQEDQVANIRVLSHPLISEPVKLDAQVLELQSLLSKNQDLVTLEIVLPNESPIQILTTVKDFDGLIKHGSPDDVLNSAERYESGNTPPTTGRRRGRPPGGKNKVESKPTGSGMSKETLAQIREWANANGHQVSSRGRIAAPIIAAWEEAHAS